MEEPQVYLFILIGAICLLIASLFAGNVEWVLGTTTVSYYGTLAIAFLLIMIAGIFWVSAARMLSK